MEAVSDFTQFLSNIFSFQLVPAVTELIVAELMYLQWMDPKEPIYLYINSTGTTRDDGETVSIEICNLLSSECFELDNRMILIVSLSPTQHF